MFQDDEEGELEEFLKEFTKDYRDYATKRRDPKGTNWSRDKLREMMEDMKKESTSPEFKDAASNLLLPPIDVITNSAKTHSSSSPRRIRSAHSRFPRT